VGIGINLLDSILAPRAQFQQEFSVKLVQLDPLLRYQIGPAISFRDFVFGPCFLSHLQKKDVSKFSHVLVIGDAVVTEDIAQVPKFLNDFGGGHAVFLSSG
jgi:hypothetical protein